MGLSISSAISTASLAAENASSSRTTSAKPQQQQTASEAAYKVELTSAQQVYNLYNQGQSVPQIASALSLSTELVNNFLRLSDNPS